MVKKILFQGDSITDANRNRDEKMPTIALGGGYPHLIAGRLLVDHMEDNLEFINRGISGNRVVDLYARWKIDALNLNPDLISILIGVNDTWHEMANHNGVDVPRFEQIYRLLLEWTRKELPQVKLVLCEPFCMLNGPVTTRWQYEIKERSQVVQKLAKEFETIFVPLQTPLDEAAKRAGNTLRVLRDGVHPMLLGHQVIADKWLEATKGLLS